MFYKLILFTLLAGCMGAGGENLETPDNELPCIQGDITGDLLVTKEDLIKAGEANVWATRNRPPRLNDRCSVYDCNRDGEFSVDDVYCVQDRVEE